MRLAPPRTSNNANKLMPEFRHSSTVRRIGKWRSLSVVVLILGLLSVGCDYNSDMTTFGTAGPVAAKQALLFDVLLWVMLVVFVLVEGALVYAAIKFRRRPGDPLPKQVHGNTVLEITWTVIPTILILALGVWSVQTLFELDKPPAGSDVLEIAATGHQWWFEFEYPDADGNGTFVTTANELRVPVNRPVHVDLHSDDVLHSFWIPRLAGKVDMVPTRNNHLWFQSDEIGVFHGQCAELCGRAHALMKFRVQVLSEDDYLAWVSGFGQEPQLSAEAAQGQVVFNGEGGCVVCHTATGSDSPATVDARVQGFLAGRESPIAPGPNLTDLATRDTFAAGILDLNRENLRKWITDPESVKSGNYMSGRAMVYQTEDGTTKLNQKQVSHVIEYLLSLK